MIVFNDPPSCDVQHEVFVGFGTGIPWVGFSHTVPVVGTGTYCTVNLTVSYGTRGTIGTCGFLVLLLLYYYYYYCINNNNNENNR